MLRVGLDIRGTEAGFKSHFGRGTGRYAAELARHLIGIPQRGCEVVALGAKEIFASKWERTLTEAVPFGRHTIESQLLLPRRIRRQKLDLVHFVAHGDAPAWGMGPYAVTVLDLIPLKFADLYRADKPGWRFRLARQLEVAAIKKASGIIAISEATKRDVVEILGIAPEKIIVTPLAVSDVFAPLKGDRSELRRELGLPEHKPVLLYVGGIDARKNALFLLEVLRELKKSVEPVLVMVGNYERDNHYPGLKEAIRKRGLEKEVILTGFVPDGAVPKYYQAADVLVFPSLYEGFGFPVLEALASGLPAVAGNNSSLPEVVGEGYPLLSGFAAARWADSILELLGGSRRQELIELGLARAREFSWKRTADLTAAAYAAFSD